MNEEDKRQLAGFLNDLSRQPANDGGSYDESLSEVAWLAGLNWSDTAGGWVVPGDC